MFGPVGVRWKLNKAFFQAKPCKSSRNMLLTVMGILCISHINQGHTACSQSTSLQQKHEGQTCSIYL